MCFRATAIALILYATPYFAHAEDISQFCGEPPLVANEILKGEIDGRVSLLTRFIGRAELTGVIELTKDDVFAKFPDADSARTNAYLFFVACAAVFSDDKLDTQMKLNAITKFRKEIISGELSEIDFTYFSLRFSDLRPVGKNSFMADLIIKNTNPSRGGISVAFAHRTMVPGLACIGTLRSSCKPKISMTDNLGIEYVPGEVSGIGMSRDNHDWTILRHDETILATVRFDKKSSSPTGNQVGDIFTYSGEMVVNWRVSEKVVDGPARKAFSLEYSIH